MPDGETTLTKLNRNDFGVYLDVSRDFSFASSQWKWVNFCTIFEMKVGEQEETKGYICYKDDITEIKSNMSELPLEIQNIEGNPVYDFMISQVQSRPTGEDAKVPFLLCYGGKDKVAQRGVATITGKTLNTVDGMTSFTLKYGGDIETGTYTGDIDNPTFVPAAEPTL